MPLDLQLFYFINGNHNIVLDYFFLFFTAVEEFAAIWIFFTVLSLIFNKKDGKKLGLMVALGLILHLVILDLVIKQFTFRARPYMALENVHRLGRIWVNSSFPAGHASSTFIGAIIFSRFYKRFRVPLFSMAFITSVSRVYLGMHYPSDVLAGAAIGISISLFVLWLEKKGLFDRILHIRRQ